ncbi:MAG: hypothetical protein HDR09_11025 [Lachnospiraceae bacterium]|nr:hypothetical protein [Lachnospiraceae bacterium]
MKCKAGNSLIAFSALSQTKGMNIKMNILKRKYLCVMLIIMLGLCGCSSNSLDGSYASEDGTYQIKFNDDGSCTWYQDGTFFNGTYDKTDDGWQLEITGNGLYSNTVFSASEEDGDLIISGGVVNNGRFVKQ